MLQQAQNVRVIAITPWLLIPGIFVVVTVLAFNFLGDGLRDAAEPLQVTGFKRPRQPSPRARQD